MGAAVEGGADIVDAKDPALGALGALAPERLALVLERVPETVQFSVALGDPGDGATAVALIEALNLPLRAAGTYVKLGLAGTASPMAAERMLHAAVAATGGAGRQQVIAVAYADAERDGLGPGRVTALARRAGARGVLVDTMYKDNGSLLDWLPPPQLDEWIVDAHRLGLLVAVAGRLDRVDLELLRTSDADVVGVRGAACEGGRGGQVSAPKVRRLRDALAGVAEERDRAAKHQSAGARART